MDDQNKDNDLNNNIQHDDIGEQILKDIEGIDPNKKSNDVVVGKQQYRKDSYIVTFLLIFIVLVGGLTFLTNQYIHKVDVNKPSHNVRKLMEKAGKTYKDGTKDQLTTKGKVTNKVSENNNILLEKSQKNIDKVANREGYNSNGFKINVKTLSQDILSQTQEINKIVYTDNMNTTSDNIGYYKSVLQNLKDGSEIKGKSPFGTNENVGKYLNWALFNNQSFDSVTSFNKENEYSDIYNNYSKNGFENIKDINSIYVQEESKKFDNNISILKANIVSGDKNYTVHLGYYQTTDNNNKTVQGYKILDIDTN